MAQITMTVDDVSILADAYPNKAEWQRVSYYDGKLIVPDDLNPSIAVVDMPAARKAALMTYARTKRWRIETGGIEVGGIAVATDDRSKLMLQGARTSAEANPAFTTRWDAGDAGVTLTSGQIIAISDAVAAHVNAVFARFDTIRDQIASGALTTKAAIDAAFTA
jgi:Domain of unknown function (DUF4376)